MAAGLPVVWCTELDLGNSLPSHLVSPESVGADEARVLVRFHGEPLEFVQVELTAHEATVSAIIASLGSASRRRLGAHLAVDGVGDGAATLPDGSIPCLHPLAAGLAVSVVVCTRDRGPALRDCLVQLKSMSHDQLEFLIVDNAPSDDATRRAFDVEVGTDSRFRYVLEPRPGLSCARNRGLAEATGQIIAYTDDDVRVDREWVGALAAGFLRRPDVACVTSLVCTAELRTPAEHYFDARVSWAGSCEPRIYDQVAPEQDSLYPYSPGLFGTGAGMAFRTEILRELGGFDEALGAGTKTAGGEDLDAFVRILQAGYALAYEPSSLVWHHHRSDLPGLQSQMFAYGSGLTAFFTKHLLDGATRRSLLRRIPLGIAKLASVPRMTLGAVGEAPVPSRNLLLREFAGMAMGPMLYSRARRKVPAQGHVNAVASAGEKVTLR